jgi:5-methyltetrahydropteroyltriglutamate--homocysteine methyltransferase
VRRSADRILVSHVGVLPRPPALDEALAVEGPARADSERALSSAVRQVVGHQRDLGIDVVNDGEFSKPEGFSRYVTERIGGIEPRELGPADARQHPDARDRLEFPGFYSRAPERAVGFKRPAGASRSRSWTCTGPLSYVGHERVAADIDRLRAAAGETGAEPFLTAVAPGTVEHWLTNEHYADDESFLMAIAETMRAEYKAITDAGIVLQIDDPDLPDGWQVHPEMDLAAYHSYAALRIDALNYALRGIPEDLVRLHVCWGSYHGPHKNDIPLAAVTDLILSVPAACYSIEGANPVHEHEWQVWQDVALPDGKMLMPGMVSHCSDLIEHPDLVAQRIVRIAKVVGRENVIAGTDCGLGHRVGHPEICWAKLGSLVEGAKRASAELWPS